MNLPRLGPGTKPPPTPLPFPFPPQAPNHNPATNPSTETLCFGNGTYLKRQITRPATHVLFPPQDRDLFHTVATFFLVEPPFISNSPPLSSMIIEVGSRTPQDDKIRTLYHPPSSLLPPYRQSYQRCFRAEISY
ncbi:hypothetical protein BJ508DRAFT_31581 [Ascobolus immersus RN42]|uniref:Uncharacterized protein n=1 Tax=Ascobolus immersus RN42 TaxID=1160509 RepID=A0A3N4IK84_ASCIM|nr:hypothetical protein BJ508DRAFT_31581 [Ascobolus immersus RN42]